jgi:hypothetical protein
MSDQINDGGPAFPRDPQWNRYGYISQEGWNGMSLRDVFAGMALQGILSKSLFPNSSGNKSISWATTREPSGRSASIAAYEIADAMIAARGEAK